MKLEGNDGEVICIEPFRPSFKTDPESTRRRRKRTNRKRLSKPFRAKFFAYFKHTCQLCCNAKATTVDHIIPLGGGGQDRRGNMIPACERCNADKADIPLTREEQKDLLKRVERALEQLES